MAKFQYGALITRISGSIGGTNFRLYKGMPVISNKSQGYSRSKLLSNPRLAQIRYIMSNWRTFSQEWRDKWQTLSNDYTFPDKFGNMRIISGQNFYMKLNVNNITANTYQPDPFAIDLSMYAWLFVYFQVNVGSQEAMFRVDPVVGDMIWLVQVEKFTGTPPAPVFNRRKIIQTIQQNSGFTENLWIAITDRVGTISENETLRLYYTAQGVSGLREPWQVVDTIAEA